MIEKIITSIFGDPDTKKIKHYQKTVAKINEAYESFSDFSKEDVQAKTAEFTKLFEWLDFTNQNDSEKINEILSDIKVEAIANLKQACTLLNGNTFSIWNDERTIEWNMIPYDVQLVGWLALHDWGISEMKTWEWKTLVWTIPAYLNALTGNPVHIVTVNDYLASRDAEEMGILYEILWMTVWVVNHKQNKEDKKAAYASNIVYATNNELWFDYLRDNMVINIKNKVQSAHFYAIIDEVDSILIDEARTPLIISMPDNEPTSKYAKFATMAKKLESWKDYKIDEKQKTAVLTEDGIQKIEWFLHVDNIYVSAHYNDLHHIENALKANAVYTKDKDYIINGEEIMIVDEHTWRALSWRRYSDWLHQAIEAKEWVEIQQESKTLASITFQNYFRMYWKLSGMTGTAKTEEEEFYKVYALDTLVIPTNKPIIRDDKSDLLFKNEKGKFAYVVNLIQEIHETEQPILVGTVSVEKSEFLSRELKKIWITHTVLNAKYHEQEAEIVWKAWEKWAVTIATNMAWRWTDIKLWEGVSDLWGLYIIGTEKHETRRIDNQLRWRAWRQWDAWATQFLISPNDDIMRIFGWDKLFWVFNSPMFATLPDDQPLAQSSMLTKKVTWVQKQVEWHHFDSRKHVLEYDDVMNKHREIIYTKRNTALESENVHDEILEIISSQIKKFTIAELNKTEDIETLQIIKKVNTFLWVEAIDTQVEIDDVETLSEIEVQWDSEGNRLANYLAKIALEEIEKLKDWARDIEEFYTLEKRILLQSIDELWMRHIHSMTKLREEVAFEWYAQRQPLVVYKEKAFEKFKDLIWDVEYKTTKAMFSINTISEVEQRVISAKDLELNEDEMKSMLENFSEGKQTTSPPKQQNIQTKSNQNPLFAQPQRKSNTPIPPVQKQKDTPHKKKIRV